jgi:hypothetical protein
MKKLIFLFALALTINNVFAQWQEITKYGPVTDFLYINKNLQYIRGDTFYRVENGKDIVVPDWGFNKSVIDEYLIENPADFVKGTLIGFKRDTRSGNKNSINIYKTFNGGKTWSFFASRTWADTLFYLSVIAVDTQTVFLRGKFFDPKSKMYGDYNWIKVRKNSFEIMNLMRFYAYLPIVLSVEDTLTWYVLGNELPNYYTIVKTRDGGKSWTVTNSDFFSTLPSKNPDKFMFLNNKVILCIGYYNISISNDSGYHWKLIDTANYINGLNQDTVFYALTIVEDMLFYLQSNWYSKYQKYYILKISDTINKIKKFVTVNKTRNIYAYDSICYIYNTTFYLNKDPVNHPLSEKEKSEIPNTKGTAYFSGNDLIIDIPPGENTNYNLNIYDYTGKLLFESKVNHFNGYIQVSTGVALPQGIYLVNLNSKEKYYNFKLIRY